MVDQKQQLEKFFDRWKRKPNHSADFIESRRDIVRQYASSFARGQYVSQRSQRKKRRLNRLVNQKSDREVLTASLFLILLFKICREYKCCHAVIGSFITNYLK